ncbi:MAG: dihydropteroate synthase [Actinobacteria bacterium]|uniref:dihydropteroate synthase n=1 Tax=freshwater metagenome TaxID=449393 RepID=A0A6J6LG10_9ZZZZ|nr:dihydropteroate synthase [Actinomycetota bacterium]MSX24777.1 dihydropteroate synthase [Actinomycetota bacterium]MSY46183.1 dihydropteroate synthase [Actinomycetota bacterium]MSY56815.1 dihydropteroate synthase [Actinomycetota bacterium]MTB00490.1 dihydropteroate synthase [Actinomycetota bacterium]
MSVKDLNLPTDRTIVMGILNVTPDSFADGGRYQTTASAIERGLVMLEEGADIIDIGGESTRPGADRVDVDEELARILPVVTVLAKAGAIISIDTKRAITAEKAISAGAQIVNDVSGGLSDSAMFSKVASLGCVYIAMHTRGDSQQMQSMATYSDVVREVTEEISQRVTSALNAGIKRDSLIVDPGLGFAKEAEDNWTLLANLPALEELGFPVLVGASRKRFLGNLTGAQNPDDREAATIALTHFLAQRGTWGVRVHSVKPHRDAIAVAGELA